MILAFRILKLNCDTCHFIYARISSSLSLTQINMISFQVKDNNSRNQDIKIPDYINLSLMEVIKAWKHPVNNCHVSGTVYAHHSRLIPIKHR